MSRFPISNSLAAGVPNREVIQSNGLFEGTRFANIGPDTPVSVIGVGKFENLGAYFEAAAAAAIAQKEREEAGLPVPANNPPRPRRIFFQNILRPQEPTKEPGVPPVIDYVPPDLYPIPPGGGPYPTPDPGFPAFPTPPGGTFVPGTPTTVTTTTSTTQTRTGLSSRINTTSTTNKSIGNKLVSLDVLPYLRSRNIEFIAKKLKPNTLVYPFFDGQNVYRY